MSKHSKSIISAMLMAAFLAALVETAFSQSLADIARQERAKTARAGKTGKVYTNDDISRMPVPTNTPTPAAEKKAEGETAKPGSTPEGTKAEGAKSPAAAKEGAKPGEKSEADLEKEYRDRFAKLRDNLATQQDKLDVMQRELNLMQTQFYSDPNVALREQTFRSQINERTQAIDQQKQVVEQAKQAIADLEEELRKNNLPAGWAR